MKNFGGGGEGGGVNKVYYGLCESSGWIYYPRSQVRWILGSLRNDDFGTTTPLDCVTGLLRMLIWALAGVAPKSTPLLTAIRRRPRKSRT